MKYFFLWNEKRYKPSKFSFKLLLTLTPDTPDIFSKEHCCTSHPFQAFGYPSLLPYMGGSVFILVIRRGVCANAAVYFKAISPMTQSHRFLVTLHMHDTTYSFSDFSLSHVFNAVDFGIVALHIDRLFVCNWFPQASSTSANNH